MKNNELLIESVIENLKEFRTQKKLRNDLQTNIIEYVMPGDLLKYIKSPEEIIPSLEIGTIYYLAKCMNEVRASTSLQLDKYFTAREMKEIETTFREKLIDRGERASTELPFTFENVIKIGEGDYILSIDGRTKKSFMDSHILQYNQETQREARMVRDKNDPNNIIPMPKVNKKSVREIAELAKKGELIQTMVTWNARLGSSDDESGEELIYNEDDKTLTILKGTLLDVVDGYHRLQGIAMALNENPNLDIRFKLNILNFSQAQAKKYFAQLNTYNPVSKSRVRELAARDYGVEALNLLLDEFQDFKDKVTHRGISPRQDALTTHSILHEAINDNFKIENKRDVIKTAKYLTKFFKEVFYSFPDEFLGDIVEIRKKSIMNAPSMFAGYVKLAHMMQENNIDLENLTDIVNNIDFSRDSEKLIGKEIVNKEGKITTDSKTKIAACISTINLDKYVKEEGVK